MDPLPAGTSTCNVHVLNTTLLDFQTDAFVSGSPLPPPPVIRCPSLCFLITHQESGERIIWDLGVRKDYVTAYHQQGADWKSYFNLEVKENVSDILDSGSISPSTISKVIFSHGHFDHVGDASLFPSAQIIMGPGSIAEIAKGEDGIVPESTVEIDKVEGMKELKGIGSYERGWDVVGDGALVACDAPGHMPGHMSLLVRVTPSPSATYLLLGGDTAHHHCLPSPTCPPHLSVHPDQCMDLAAAKISLQWCKDMEARDDVMCVLAHDARYWEKWTKEGRMGLEGNGLGRWKEEGLKMVRGVEPEGLDVEVFPC